VIANQTMVMAARALPLLLLALGSAAASPLGAAAALGQLQRVEEILSELSRGIGASGGFGGGIGGSGGGIAGSIDTLDAQHYSPLMHAASQGHYAARSAGSDEYAAVAKTLLAAGASVDLQNARGSSALMLAAAHGATPIAAALVAAGAAVDLADTQGATALMRAAEWSRAAVVELLLEAGASAALRDSTAERRTALDWARSRAGERRGHSGGKAGADGGDRVQALLRAAAAAAKEL
jgi:hypothetical protein